MMDDLKPCPCGQTPKNLCIVPSADGSKWAYVYGGCCGDWNIEFRTNYNRLDSDECMKIAIEYWNDAERGNK